MSVISTSDQITMIREQISNLQIALLEDSKNPRPSYSVGGQSVDRNAFRQNLMGQINDLYKLMRMMQPVEIRSIAI